MTTPCELVQIEYQGNGSQVIFPFPFPYEFKTEVKVALWNNTQKRYIDVLTTDATYPWEVSDANPTAVTFTSTAPPSPPSPGVNEDPIFNVRIYRTTDITDIRAVFNQGSAIRATDLNRNFDQLRSAIQEGKCQVSDKVFEYLEEYYWNKFDETIYSTANGGTWVSNDQKVATTAAVDDRVDDKIDFAITNDIGTDGTGITVTDDGDGTITLGLGPNSIDFDRIKDVDIITTAEQDAGTPSWAGDDTKLATIGALAKRLDIIYQSGTPTGTTWQTGKLWYDHLNDQTLSIWDGASQLWRPISSGGTFVEQPTVIWVDGLNGLDSNNGHRIIDAMKTIKAAVASANPGDIVLVLPGVYQETLPIDITVSNLSIVGQSIRSCFVIPTPATAEETMFRCNSGTYISNFTFAGLKASGARGGYTLDPDPTYGLPTNQGWVAAFYPNAVIRKSPYIQNCTNFTDSAIDLDNFDPNNFQGTGGDTSSQPTGGGILVDGSVVSQSSPLRSFVVDSFTQICLDGPGVLCTNNGYAQLVSFFGTFCHYHAKARNGGQLNLSNCTTDFGRYGLIADGKSPSAIFTSTASANASIGASTFSINATTPGIDWHGDQTNPRPVDNMLVVISGNTYPIKSSAVNGGGWTVTLADGFTLLSGVTSGDSVSFYLRSLVSTGGHTFEYVGSGTDYNALPDFGGVADETKQVVEQNDGAVWQSSTDHNGKFKVGSVLIVDQNAGIVTYNGTALAPSATTDTTNATNISSGTLSAARLADSGVSAGSYGSASSSVSITVDTKGRVTSLTNAPITISAGSVTGLAASATVDTTNAGNITSGTLNAARLPASGVSAGSYTNSNVTVDSTGRITSISNGSSGGVGTVTNVSGVAPIQVVNGTTTPSVSITNATTSAAGAMSAADKTKLDGIAAGATANTGTVTSVGTGTGLTGGPITTSGTISLANTAVTPGSYTAANITVDAQGRITAASNGAAGATDIDGLSDGTTQWTENVGLGTGTLNSLASGGQENTGLGYAAGQAITTNDNNTLIGSRAGQYNSASNNTAVGRRALAGTSGSSTGGSNIACGNLALTSLTTGEFNTALGSSAGLSTTTGGQSVFIGGSAGLSATTASNNIYIGYASGLYQTGAGNTTLGWFAMSGSSGSSTGTNNTCLGKTAGYALTSGANNTFVGNGAGDSVTSGGNNIIIGATADASTATTSNEVTIGDTNITKFRVPGINFILKDNGGTPTVGQVLTADASGEGYWANGGVTYELIEDGASKAAGSYINISGYKAIYMICHNDPATNSFNRNGPYLSTSNTSNTGVSTRNGRWWRRDSSNTYDTASASLSTNSLYYGSNSTSDVNKVWKLSLQGLNTSNVFIEAYSENNGAAPTYTETAWSGVTTSGSSTWYLYIHQALLEYQIYGVK